MTTLGHIIRAAVARATGSPVVHRPSYDAGFDDATRMWADMLADGVPPERVETVMRLNAQEQP